MIDTNIYLVLGMHRSGTSLVSGLLHQSGIIMGTPDNFLPKPNKENPKGFFENFDFRQINDRFLESAGYIVKDWNREFDPRSINLLKRIKIQRQMQKILLEYAQKYYKWGWKDPRQMLTCSQWYKALKATKLDRKLKVIFVYRNPLSVAVSMQKRGNIEELERGLDIWYLYNQTAFSFLEKEQLPCLTFSFENLTQNTATVMSELSKFVEVAIKPEIYQQFIEPKLVRSQTKNPELNKLLDNKIEVKNLLSELAVWELPSPSG